MNAASTGIPILNEPWEWLDRAEQAREVAGPLCHVNASEHALRAKTRHSSCGCDSAVPLCVSFGSEDPQCGSGNEVALKVEATRLIAEADSKGVRAGP